MTIDYGAVKSVHVGAAALSIALFVARGAWLLRSPQLPLQPPWVRIPPHVVDTVLLLAALWLAAQQAAGSPHAWLAAKIVALIAYIVLGTIALKRGRTRATRIAAFAAAVATFGYIVTVALTRSPLGFLAWR
jgi:uncharacterized membrane protein SirB2